jgi:hypothetical protein
MYRRLDWHELSRRAGAPFLVFALVTWAAAWHLGAQRPEPDLYPFLKKSWPGADFVELANGGFEVRRQGQVVGYATSGTASGYSGPITCAWSTCRARDARTMRPVSSAEPLTQS